MTTEELRVSSLVPASPNRIFAAWMDERQHSAFTGGRAHIDPWVGGRVSAWDGYIYGNHLFLETGRRIVMAWRTTDFPPDAPDSQVDVGFEPVAGGTKVSIAHTGIPEGQSEKYREGWRTHYLDPMRRYFAKPGAMKAAIRAAVKGGILSQAGLTASRPTASRGAHNVFASDAPPPFTGAAPQSNAKLRLAKLRKAREEREAAAKAAGAPPAAGAPAQAGAGPAKSSGAKAPAPASTEAQGREAASAEEAAKPVTPEKKPAAAKKPAPAAQAASAKKPAAAKKTPAKKKPAAAQAVSAKKPAAAKKTPAKKKPAAKKPAPKKAPAKKTPTKKPVPKKTPAKKAPAAKKPAPKKAPAKKKPSPAKKRPAKAPARVAAKPAKAGKAKKSKKGR